MTTIHSLTARAVFAPIKRPLQTSTGAVSKAPMVLLDLTTSEGVVGRSYLFAVTPLALKAQVALIEDMASLLIGQPLVPFEIERLLTQRFTLLGAVGLVGMAISGIDMAVWDALAIQAKQPLACLLGGQLKPVTAYNSCGLGLTGQRADVASLAREANELLAGGFTGMKLRLGYADLNDDVAAVKAVQSALPVGVRLMTDYNQGLDPSEAIRRGHALDDLGLTWIEEPVRADDHAGCARVAAALKTPVQIGENYWGSRDMSRAIAAQASDYVMPDLERIGGVSGWLRAAAIADAAALPMSTHLFPEVSAHLMCVTPTAHWLEYVDWANPILKTPLEIVAGQAVLRNEPGSGIDWDEAQVKKYAY